MFVRFALRVDVLEIFHILGFHIVSHVNISNCHRSFKIWHIGKKCDMYRVVSVPPLSGYLSSSLGETE